VINELGPFLGETSARPVEIEAPSVQLSNDESVLFDSIGSEPVLVDHIAQKSGQPTQSILTCLLTLELKGLIRKLPGNKYVRS
jgi:DNA processing protein